MRQIIYISTSAAPAIGDGLAQILRSSQRNNAAAGLTGLLWTDGRRFLQVLEGGRAAIQSTLDRIRADPRHRALVVFHDREAEARSFERWSMKLVDDSDAEIELVLANAASDVRGTFEGVIAARRQAA